MSAAVAGSISPALLAPSVTSTTTRLFACERRRRVSEVARPEPIAVPSGSIASFTSSSWRSSTAVSVVGGDLVRLRPANTTRPSRSLLRRPTNSATTSFATSSRFFGWKSSAAIEPETSSATTMSTPWVVTSSRSEPCCGRASASAAAASASAPSTSGAWRSDTRQPGLTRSSRAAPGNETAGAARSRSRSQAAASTSGATSAAQSHSGSWKRKPPQSITRPCRPARPGPAGELRLERRDERPHRREVAIGLRSEALALGELDAVGRLGHVAHGRRNSPACACVRRKASVSADVISRTGAPSRRSR